MRQRCRADRFLNTLPLVLDAEREGTLRDSTYSAPSPTADVRWSKDGLAMSAMDEAHAFSTSSSGGCSTVSRRDHDLVCAKVHTPATCCLTVAQRSSARALAVTAAALLHTANSNFLRSGSMRMAHLDANAAYAWCSESVASIDSSAADEDPCHGDDGGAAPGRRSDR